MKKFIHWRFAWRKSSCGRMFVRPCKFWYRHQRTGAGKGPSRPLSGNYRQDVSPERLNQYFDKINGQYQIRKSIRDCCVFAKQDVTRDPPFSRVDLISCRNVLIYLGAVLQKAVLPMMFQYSLKETGLLFLRQAETIGSAGDLFQVVDDKNKIFTRKAVPIRFSTSFPISRHPIDPSPADPGIPRLVDVDWQRQADQVIQSRYAPDGVIINQDLQIQQLRGRTGFYLQPSSGGKIQNLLLLAHASLQVPLREAVMAAMAAELRRSAARLAN